jgi:hypothetical protein
LLVKNLGAKNQELQGFGTVHNFSPGSGFCDEGDEISVSITTGNFLLSTQNNLLKEGSEQHSIVDTSKD